MHSVGVHHIEQYDRTRSFAPQRGMLASAFSKQKERGRPIQTVIWYPAEKGGQPVKYNDYLQLVGWETDFDGTPQQRKRTVDAWLNMVTDGKRNGLAYNLGARYILNFLNANLNNDPSGRAYLVNKLVNNSAPPHALTMQYMPAKGKR